ncbi:hypothetical protein [Pelagibaculum spongiae]|uniref:hypothetical protein n=1 Tax=Pelagibaculum spongiae TaxID=2080658 RepID=UPI001314B5F9|nr:hypothetical protein [Pelagibaculum spongiae]
MKIIKPFLVTFMVDDTKRLMGSGVFFRTQYDDLKSSYVGGWFNRLMPSII